MASLLTLSMTAVLVGTLTACAQTPIDQAAHHPGGNAAAPAGMTDRMAMMDTHMKTMRDLHEKMTRARTPEERQALMAEHMKSMQDGMKMMGGMGPGGMGMGATGEMKGPPGAPADMAARQQMMEKRMEVMQSMMQMMMDRMQVQPPSTK